MKKSTKTFILAGVMASLSIVFSTLVYAVSKRPEEEHARQVFVNGFSEENSTVYKNFDEWDGAVKTWVEARLLQPVTLTSERGSITVTLTALGLEPDWINLNKNIKNYMTESTTWEKIHDYFLGHNVEIPLTVNQFTFQNMLRSSGFEQVEKNASFAWDGTQVSIVPEQLGYEIDEEPLLVLMKKSFSIPVLETEWKVALLTREPEVTTVEAESLLPTAEALATRTVKLKTVMGETIEFQMFEHLDWIKPRSGYHSAGFDWEIEENAFLTYLEMEWAPRIETDPASVVITENADGTIAFEGSARFGVEINRADLKADLFSLLAVEAESNELLIPVTQTQPTVTVSESLKTRGITDLVGVGYSDFSGSPSNRIHNIRTGIQLYNGIFIEQGAEFSFMEHMPEVDARNGFLPELVIKGDETIPEYGGGLCQVSSTMFRAVLYSGLPVTARKNHSYAVAYYARPLGYGLDATVYDPAPDLKFVNDTPADILVQSYIEGSSAYYVFYGTNDGRTVTMDGPYSYDYRSIPPSVTTYTDELAPGERQLDSYGHTGFTTDWLRTVTYPADSISPYALKVSGVPETIHSVYEARPAKYLEGKTEATEGATME